MMFSHQAIVAALITATSAASSPTIAQINGNKFLSPYNGQSVTGVKGVVTAVGPSGFWIRSTTPDNDNATSESIYVYGSSAASDATVGNLVTLNGRVSEYRSSSAYLYLTEIGSPSKVTVVSSNNAVEPIVLGQNGLNPPTDQFTSLDNGDVFAVPNNQSLVSKTNPTLQPTKYGLDFWESLSGELVTVKGARAVGKPNEYGDTWVIGSWPTTGSNSRGGLTITNGDGNPEAIVIGDPLDGTSNPQDTKLGDSLDDITGVITQVYGFYTILPLTKITIASSPSPDLPSPTNLTSTGKCSGITLGQYNVENFMPNDTTHINDIASDIVKYLREPDIIFLQEIQDDSGSTDDGVVDANQTLSNLRDAISSISSSGVNYSFVDINPVNDEDGGEPGGNIRVAYLYNPQVLQLRDPNPGSSTQATEVLPGPSLSYNPGRIDPSNAAWDDSRKPLAAQWEVLADNSTFFTINVQWTAKLGSSTLQGDPRPPVNAGVTQRTQQANVTGTFAAQILAQDSNAAVILAGDFNEFKYVQPIKTLTSVSGLTSLDDVVGTPDVEQYTYLYVQNSQELDHLFVSPKLAGRNGQAYSHVHVNTWVTYDDQYSDHDPSVAFLNVCS